MGRLIDGGRGSLDAGGGISMPRDDRTACQAWRAEIGRRPGADAECHRIVAIIDFVV
jgi:hypothetical protein